MHTSGRHAVPMVRGPQTRILNQVPAAEQGTEGGVRPTTTQRGYGSAHQAERKRWEPIVKAGRASCWRCTEPITPDADWDLGHDDHDRSKYMGPEHPACNRATAGRQPLTRRNW